MAIGFVSLVQPRYTADAKVIIENGESYFTRPDKTDLQQQVLPDDEAVQSQVQLISSRDIAREAIRRLDLKGNPEFDPLAKGLDPVSRLLVLFGLQRDPTSVAPEERILQAYYDRLMVFPLVKTRVITIEFTATDPDLAARAANTIAELYIEAQSAAKRDSARSASDSLGTLVADLRARSAEADAQADAYRSSNGLLVGTNNNTITSQQLADISTQLAQSRTAEADAQAKAKLIREMIRQGRVGEVPDVANNELIRRISEQRVTLRAELAQQGRTLLPGHPRMQELNAQLQDVDNQLRSAAEKAVRTLENDAHIATSRVENLSAALDEQKKTASTAGADQVKLNTLELQSRLLKEQLEFNTGKYQEALARMAATSTPADARVISRADPPQLPSFPKKLPIILIATLAGLILSVGVLVSSELALRPRLRRGGRGRAGFNPAAGPWVEAWPDRAARRGHAVADPATRRRGASRGPGRAFGRRARRVHRTGPAGHAGRAGPAGNAGGPDPSGGTGPARDADRARPAGDAGGARPAGDAGPASDAGGTGDARGGRRRRPAGDRRTARTIRSDRARSRDASVRRHRRPDRRARRTALRCGRGRGDASPADVDHAAPLRRSGEPAFEPGFSPPRPHDPGRLRPADAGRAGPQHQHGHGLARDRERVGPQRTRQRRGDPSPRSSTVTANRGCTSCRWATPTCRRTTRRPTGWCSMRWPRPTITSCFTRPSSRTH